MGSPQYGKCRICGGTFTATEIQAYNPQRRIGVCRGEDCRKQAEAERRARQRYSFMNDTESDETPLFDAVRLPFHLIGETYGNPTV